MRSLRPFGFAFGWLLLFEVLLRLCCAPDPRTVRDPEHPYGCFADDELGQLIAARDGDGAAGPLDVILIGDSVLASVENARGQRLVDALQPALQEALSAGPALAPPRVWALSAGGARAVDVYAMLRRVERALRAGRRGTQGVLVVVSSNPIFFSRRHLQPAMAYPCLAAELAQAGAAAGIADPRLRLASPMDSALGRLEHRLLQLATEHIYVLQQRRRLAEALFGGPPRLVLRERLQHLHHRRTGRAASAPAGLDEQAQRDRPWTERHLLAAQFASSYDFVPLDSPAAVNLLWTRVLAGWLGAHPELGSLALLVPQNHALLGALAEGPAYTAVTTAVAAAFAGAGVPFVSYDRDPALRSEHFLDLDHLTAAGNRALAERLARELAPRLRALAGSAR